MPVFDLSTIKQIVELRYEPAIERAFGMEGMASLRLLRTKLHSLFEHLEPGLISDQFIVYIPVNVEIDHTGHIYEEIPELADSLTPHVQAGPAALLLAKDGKISWKSSVTDDFNALSTSCIVYKYFNRREVIIVKGSIKIIPNPSELHVSVFAIPTFTELESALEDYKQRQIRGSRCIIFNKSWGNTNRLLFKYKPEVLMRESLTNFLQITLRNTEVKTDDDPSAPIDIIVTWMLISRLALIEIKWLGLALTSEADSTYIDDRQRAGTDVLESYIETINNQDPNTTARCYLVLIDGRRHMVDHSMTQVSFQDGMYYSDADVVLPSPAATPRVDFATPIRMFAEPICITV